jgi:hypothetical protein
MSRLHFAAGCLLGTFLFVAAAVEAGEQPPTPESEAIAELRQEIAELRKLVLELKKQVSEQTSSESFHCHNLAPALQVLRVRSRADHRRYSSHRASRKGIFAFPSKSSEPWFH